MKPNWKNKTIFTGDNLPVVRGMESESVDLVYLDPPFNSNRDYNAAISGAKQAKNIFKDTWTENDTNAEWYGEIAERSQELYDIIAAAKISHGKGMKAYLTMMAIRLIELHRILKPAGSLYLHCDPTASHYLKLVMDCVFGAANFRNEIVWERVKLKGKTSQHGYRKFGSSSDSILFYTKGSGYPFHMEDVMLPYTEDELARKYPHTDAKGRYAHKSPFRSPSLGERHNLCYEYKGVRPPHRSGWTVKKEALQALDEAGELVWRESGAVYRKWRPSAGSPMNNIWTDIAAVAGRERTAYPTQKPLALLERIIKASSAEGDVVFDPFCGCATTLVAADDLKRQWIGCDISPMAASMVIDRITDAHGKALAIGGRKSVRAKVEAEITHSDIPPARKGRTAESGYLALTGGLPKKAGITQAEKDAQRRKLFGEQEGKCSLCAVQFPYRNLTRDHIVPRASGGTDEISNIQLLCQACNSFKGTKSMQQAKKEFARQGYGSAW